jgi:hypothetical protein
LLRRETRAGAASVGRLDQGLQASASAKARPREIERFDSADPILGAEYDYVAGTALLRVPGKLTPTEAKQDTQEFATIMGAPAVALDG